MIFTLARRELRSLFLSPLAWVILAVAQIILSWVFFSSIDVFFKLQPELANPPGAPGATDLIVAPLLETASIILLMISPLLTMRLISEEQRTKTLTLLVSSPLGITEIILGKYLGIITFMFIFVCLLSLMPLSLLLGTQLDLGKTLSGLFGLYLLLCAISAAGLYMSSLTDNPMIAAISTFGLLLLLWIMDTQAGGADGDNIFSYLSLTSHFSSLLRGLLRSVDISYFLLFITTFLVLAIRQMETRRLQS